MKEMKIMRAIGDIDDRYINEAAPAEKPKALRFNAMSRYAGIAAAAVLAIGIGVLVMNRGSVVETNDPAQTGDMTVQIFSVPEETDTVQLGNPLEYYDTLEEAVQAVGFDITAPESIGKYTDRTICVIAGDMIEITYTDSDGDPGAYIRKEKGTEDPSGAYYYFETILPLQSRDGTMSGISRSDGTVDIYKAIWTDGTYAYSVTAPYDYSDQSGSQTGFTQSEMEEIIKNVK